MVDFAAESSFASSSKRLQLHHRIKISPSAIRNITLHHGSKIAKAERVHGVHGNLKSKGAACIITEIDGSMAPIVSFKEAVGSSTDRRKHRHCSWQEVRLCAARQASKTFTYYGASFGSVEEAGYQWSATVAKQDWGMNTHLHVVGDGAPWIPQQCNQCLGASYLLDFYHVCEYLAAASHTASTHKRWLEVQKARLKRNRSDLVLKALKPYAESESCPDNEAPVRAAIRYLSNRLAQLDYQGAISQDLPIGSGMIESGHRHVLQNRLKIAGAWWTAENAKAMIALRVARANDEDKQYWEKAA